MTSQEFNKSLLFGKVAELVFEYLITSMDGWKVTKCGVENHIQELKNNLSGEYGNLSVEKVRHMPDFFIFNKKEKKFMFVEVKNTHFVDFISGMNNELIFKFKKGSIQKYLEHWKDAMLFVAHTHEPYFYMIDLKDVDEKKHKLGNEVFKSRENAINYEKPMERWNFRDIKKNLKEVFPNLKDEDIAYAEKIMMSQKTEKKK